MYHKEVTQSPSNVEDCGLEPLLEPCDDVYVHVCQMRPTVTEEEIIPITFYNHDAARVSMVSTESARNCFRKP